MTKFINNVKTAVLLGGLFGLILLIVAQWGQQGLFFAFIFGGIGNFIAYFYSDKIAIAAMRGHEVDERTAPDLVHMVARLAKNADLPMPRVYVCPQEAPNAFATGRNPKHAAVAVTGRLFARPTTIWAVFSTIGVRTSSPSAVTVALKVFAAVAWLPSTGTTLYSKRISSPAFDPVP